MALVIFSLVYFTCMKMRATMRGLERGDRERNNRIEFSEIDSCDPRGKDGTDNQDRPDQPVQSR